MTGIFSPNMLYYYIEAIENESTMERMVVIYVRKI